MKKAAAILAVFVTAFLFMFSGLLHAQEDNKWEKFKQLPFPEKRWVMLHPFIAVRAYSISSEAQKKAAQVVFDTRLDGDADGGQVDAFRHTYWMARMAQEFHWRKAISLGRAHEKGNKIYFRKHKLEEGRIPDYESCEMDMLNNKAGVEIGRYHKDLSKDDLTTQIIDKIRDGKLWIMKKKLDGRYLDCDGKLLKTDSLERKWISGKCIVPS
ncbi:MAG: hypothetical protein ABIJ16_08785, partial [Bacteroidota bacterium]